jgi:Flagellar hook-length control protein FliK.
MQIDTNAISRAQASTSASLTPELEQLLTELKVQLGQKLDASVTQVTALTEAEKQQLLAARATDKPVAGQRTLIAVLQDPEVKLAELTIRDRSIATLTNLPLQQNAKVQVLVTHRGLLVLPSVIPTETPPVLSPKPAPAGLPLVQAAPLPVQPTPSATTPLPVQVNTPPAGPAPTAAISSQPTVQPAVPAPVTDIPVAKTPSTPLPVAVSGKEKLLAAAVSQTLPAAQPLKALLRSEVALRGLVTRSPPESVPPSLVKLGEALTKIAQLGVDPTKVNPDSLRQAMNASGLFYERRLVAENVVRRAGEPPAQPLVERDIKGALIQLSQWVVGQTFTPAPAVQTTSDTLAQLMMSLTRLFAPRSESPKGAPTRGLDRAVQELVEKSLAQVQLQQYRTLSSQVQDPTAPAQWHLDTPLKLPDGYGNLYMHLFEPRPPVEEKASGKQKRTKKEGKGRWRVFLELELDHMGALAAEIAVQDKNVEATLWAEDDDLRERANAQLTQLRQDLEQQGMVVTDLRCSDNPPPDQKIRLDYALIDVKT